MPIDIDNVDNVGTINEIVNTLFGEGAQATDIVILLTILTLLPSILMMLTGFTRIIIVLSFVRQALGMQQTPPNQVLIGLALFLTFFVMQPIFARVYEDAYVPFTEGYMTQDEFLEAAMDPMRDFMLSQVFETDLNFFINLSGEEFDDIYDVPNSILIPAFITSEIKHAMFLGFFIYLPFIVIDMIVASTLMALGMMMLPPAMISLPFKVLLFVMIDGWQLIIGTMLDTFVQVT
ncbi:MAG: flagellar type III secretion system pore protein FliP [Oscillospiraceae bacterium]|nr:flagellar type III secretion system pore protein FliP [Oscillospiraceae bacterium]MCL2278268.1 flagellar type III secretion system pore protein FliP [Oscillospiraceae bacterium]